MLHINVVPDRPKLDSGTGSVLTTRPRDNNNFSNDCVKKVRNLSEEWTSRVLSGWKRFIRNFYMTMCTYKISTLEMVSFSHSSTVFINFQTPPPPITSRQKSWIMCDHVFSLSRKITSFHIQKKYIFYIKRTKNLHFNNWKVCYLITLMFFL